VEAFRMRGVGLPARIYPVLTGVQQEDKRIAKRDMDTTHIDKAMHLVVGALHEETHVSEIDSIQDVVLSLGGDWRTRNKSGHRRRWIGRITRGVAVGTRAGDEESIASPRSSRVLPRWADRLTGRSTITHEVRREEVQRSGITSTQVSVRNGSRILFPIP